MKSLALILLAVAALLPASRAAALSCMDPRAAAKSMEVVVAAKVVERPSRQEMRLQVAGYYQGEGPDLIWGRLEGIDGGTNWLERDPAVGTEAVIGLRRRGDWLVNQPCHPFVSMGSEQAALIMNDLGPARPPTGEPEPRPTSNNYAVGGSIAVIAGMALAIWLWKRMRRPE